MALGDYPLFGISGDYALLQRTIEELHRDYDVLFVGAAGTGVCTVDNTIAFPARLPQVMAVTAAKDQNTLHSTACGGPAVALAVQLPDCSGDDMCRSVPTTGMDDGDFFTFGGSSDATAVMAGVAALVWSQHPDWNRDQVRARLIESGSAYPLTIPPWQGAHRCLEGHRRIRRSRDRHAVLHPAVLDVQADSEGAR